jgi:hypothetical protein
MISTGTRGTVSHSVEKLKQLYAVMDESVIRETELLPFFCVEARVDFNDVRTGFRHTMSLSKALEIYSDTADLLWTDDMIYDIDLSKTTRSVPTGARLGSLPDFVNGNFLTRMEDQFVQYLLRSFEARIYRNYDLNLYSFSGESRDDFQRRCLDLFEGAKRQELDALHDVIGRKLEQLKQKYLGAAEIPELEQTRPESRNRDGYTRCSERITELFNSAEHVGNPVAAPPQFSSHMQEFEERLLSLEWEVQQAIQTLADSYAEKAGAIDEYILHPNLKDVHFVRSCILWMSKGTP